MNNISLSEYKSLLESVNAAVLTDLNTVDGGDVFLGVRLACRDDEDAQIALGWDRYRLFPRFAPDLVSYMHREYVAMMAAELDGEPVENRFYWLVTKYRNTGEEIQIVYEAYFLLNGKPDAVCYRPCESRAEYEPATAGESYLAATKEQLLFASNVELPFSPGDILRVDAAPYGKPFYAVFGAEHSGDLAYFTWTKKEYGYYKRRNYCVYISEDRNGLGISALTDGFFTDYIAFPHAPLERLTVADHCDDPLLMKVSRLLKADAANFYRWLEMFDTVATANMPITMDSTETAICGHQRPLVRW